MHEQTKYLHPPDDPIRAIFPASIISRLRGCEDRFDGLRRRLDILGASGPAPSDPYQAEELEVLKARKAAWETYLQAAFACGLLEGETGAELRARLTGVDNDGFRSAMAECMACWFLAGHLHICVTPKPCGRQGKVLDLLAHLSDGDINVEVKAPYVEKRQGLQQGGRCVDVIERCLTDANKQFADSGRNVLFLVPTFGHRIFKRRYSLIRALLGQYAHTWSVNKRSGMALDDGETMFKRDGQLLRPKKEDGGPAYTRVSAIVCVEERVVGHSGSWVKHEALVVHNPNCKKPIPTDIWEDCIQFRLHDDERRWDDNVRIWP
jgi:hypothetical protein